MEDPDRCYQAAQSKDARFDGWFFCAVTSTGIYCRPSCPARTPKRVEHPLLPHGRGGPAGRLPGLPALPARCDTGFARVERAGRCRGAGHAARPRRHRRPRGRGGSGPPTRLQHPPAQPPRHGRGGHRSAGPGPGPAQPDRPRAPGDDGPAHHADRVRRRLRQRAPVQRDGAPDLRRHTERPPHPRRQNGARTAGGA